LKAALPKPEISPNAKPLDARRAFSEPRGGYSDGLNQTGVPTAGEAGQMVGNAALKDVGEDTITRQKPIGEGRQRAIGKVRTSGTL
jgi:hypothetical protein